MMLSPAQCPAWRTRTKYPLHFCARANARHESPIRIYSQQTGFWPRCYFPAVFRYPVAHLFARHPLRSHYDVGLFRRRHCVLFSPSFARHRDTPCGIKNGSIQIRFRRVLAHPARYMPFARLLFTGLAPRPNSTRLLRSGQQKSLAFAPLAHSASKNHWPHSPDRPI